MIMMVLVMVMLAMMVMMVMMVMHFSVIWNPAPYNWSMYFHAIPCKCILHKSILAMIFKYILATHTHNKSDSKRRNTLGYLYLYMCRGLRMWNNQDSDEVELVEVLQKMETLKQSVSWSGQEGYYAMHLSTWTNRSQWNIDFKLNFIWKVKVNYSLEQ